MEKMTNKKALEFVLSLEVVVANEEVFAKLSKMLEQVEKKNSSTGKDGKKVLSATQKQNEALKVQILEVLQGQEKALQIKEMIGLPIFAEKEISNQKMSALVRQLVQDGLVIREEIKKVATFKVA